VQVSTQDSLLTADDGQHLVTLSVTLTLYYQLLATTHTYTHRQ